MKKKTIVIIVLVIIFLLVLSFIAFKYFQFDTNIIEGYPIGCGKGCRRRRRRNAENRARNQAIAVIISKVKSYAPSGSKDITSWYMETYTRQIKERKCDKRGRNCKMVTRDIVVTENVFRSIPNTRFPIIENDNTLYKCLISINNLLNYNKTDSTGKIVFDDTHKIVWLALYISDILKPIHSHPFNNLKNDYPRMMTRGADLNDISDIDTKSQQNYFTIKKLSYYADSLDINSIDPTLPDEMAILFEDIYTPFKNELLKLI